MTASQSFDRALPVIVVLAVIGLAVACYRMLTGV